ncbi:hypothetical protein [Limnohabitans planktonicus]|nr:hypothetical protein [Limnohabitans planktonicus]
MRNKQKSILTVQHGLTALACACLVACGGGSSPTATGDNNASNNTSNGSSSTQAQSLLTGTAAYGAPMAGASITLMDAAGTTKTATADSTGNYTLTVTGLTAPFLIKASMPSGDSVKEYSSLVMTAPKAGDTGVANVTPLTHALVSMVSSDGANPNEFADKNTLKNVDPAKLTAALKNLQTALAEVLSAAKLPATFDPMTTSFKADRDNEADLLLDTIKVGVSDQGVSLTNARVPASDTGSNTAPATITLKGTTTGTVTALPKPTVATDDLKGLDAFQAEANACLALAPAARVSQNNGSYTFLGACANVTGFDTNNYKAFGYSLQQLWGYRLLNEIPADSKLLTPEFLLFLDDGKKAIVRLASASPSGGKVYFETAQKIGDVWKIVGNQRDYDASVGVRLFRQNDLSTNGWTIPSTYINSLDSGKNVGKFDAYTSRLSFSFNQSGPNGYDVYAVRVKGPGLPASGIVLSRSSACGTNDYLAFYSNNGSLPAPNSSSLPTSSATNSWVLDVANFGSAYKGTTTEFFNQYRGLNSLGSPSTSTGNNTAQNRVDLSTIPEFAVYNWEVFTNAVGPNVAATFRSRIITRPLAATEGKKQAWATLNQDALDYLNPNNTAKAAELNNGQFSWALPNATAPIVVNGYIFGSGDLGRMNMGRAVTKSGDTSLNLTASAEYKGNGQACNYAKVPTFTSTSGYREVGIRQVTESGLMLSQYSFHTGRAAP